MARPHQNDDRRAGFLPDGALRQHERKPLVPRFVVILFAVGLIWTWVLLLGWWLLRDGAG